MEQISPTGPVYQAGTLSGNPIAVTAGIETLKKLTDESYIKLERLGAYLEMKLQALIDKHEYPLSQERVGSMFSLFFHLGPIRNTLDVAQCDIELFKRCFHFLLEHGIYMAPSQYEAGFISLAHDRQLLDQTIGQISDALKNIYVTA